MLLAQSRSEICASSDRRNDRRPSASRTFRFEIFLPVKIDNETVRDANFVRRAIVQRERWS
jgi:hypothetical protein